MEVICLEEKAFYSLVEEVVSRLKERHNHQENKWISDEQAMALLNVKSKTTMQKLRDEGKIRFSQPQKKIILYDRQSIESYFEAAYRKCDNYILDKIDEIICNEELANDFMSDEYKSNSRGFKFTGTKPDDVESRRKLLPLLLEEDNSIDAK